MPKYPLNIAQQQAVEYTNGPLLIVAGAGTGKTTVITQKIAYLIENKLVTPEQILALTFTDKAAGEMQDRVNELVNLGYAEMQISTFHSFCQRLLENHGLDIGLPNQFKVYKDTDAWLMMRKNLDKFNLDYYRPLGNPTRHIHELLKHFSKCKDELITPGEYLEFAEGLRLDGDHENIKTLEHKNKKTKKQESSEINNEQLTTNKDSEINIDRLTEVANAYHVYNQLLLDNNALDFGDLIFYTHRLLTERPNILKLLQKRFKYILVDEFQDVNWAQYQLVRMIAGENSQLTVVGDDDQSIYAFRGASVSNIMRFKEDYPAAKEIVLTGNYRSAQEILDLAYKSIQNNNPDRLEVKLKIDKRLVSKCRSEEVERQKNPLKSEIEGILRVAQDDSVECGDDARAKSVCHIHSNTLDDEVKSVIEEIGRLKNIDAEATWDDFAILVRANNHAAPFMERLEKAGIPYEFLASSGLFRQPIVLDCINFLKLTDDYHESIAMFRLLHLPCWNFQPHDIQKLAHQNKKKTESYYSLLQRAAIIGLSPEGCEIAVKLISLINNGLQWARAEKPSVVIYKFLESCGYLEYLTKAEENGDRKVIRQIYHLKQWLDYVTAYETNNPGARVNNFLEQYEYVVQSGETGLLREISDTPDSVNIMTVHKSKGLEFKYVFVVNLVEDRFPGRDRGDAIEVPLDLVKEQLPEGDEHLQEERRLFYVAVTRAKKRLYLTSADDYGGKRAKKVSRFLNELGFVTTTCHPERSEGSLRLRTLRDSSTTLRFAQNDNGVAGQNADFVYDIPESFSFSQIKTYATCPYQYKLANILKIPTRGSGVFSFGTSMHSAMQEFYRRVQELNGARQETLFGAVKSAPKSDDQIIVPTLDELLAIYEKSWIDDWYADKLQKENYYKKGKEILKTIFEDNQDKWTVPVGLERGFKIKIGEDWINGRIDRIDQLPDGALEIVDYKTGTAKDKLSTDDKDQLLIYQIAVTQLPEFRNIGPLKQLTYFYLNENQKITFTGTDKDIAKLQDKVIEIIAQIKQRNFTATPSKHICAGCDFRDICESRE